MARKLTDKRKRFVEEYIIDLNATQAAIRAGYSVRTAKSQGQRLLTKVDIQEAISAAIKKRSEKAEIDAAWVLKKAALMFDADIGDILGDDGAYLPISEWPKIWRQMLSAMDIKELTEWDGEKREKIGEIVKIRFIDKLKALEMIGKHVNVQAFRESMAVEVIDRASVIAKARERASGGS